MNLSLKPVASRLLIAGGLLLAVTAAPLATPSAHAQAFKPTGESLLAAISLPKGAYSVAPKEIPAKLTAALKTMMNAAGSQVKSGKTELFAWTGQGYKRSQASGIKAKVAAALKRAGWEYDESAKTPEAPGLIMVRAMRTVPKRQALIGFWADSDEALLLAWTEILPANTPAKAVAPTNGTVAPKSTERPSVTSALIGLTMPTGTHTITDEDTRTQALANLDVCLSHAFPLMYGRGLRPVASSLEIVEWKDGPSQDEFNTRLEKAGFNTLGFLQDKTDASLSCLDFVRWVSMKGEKQRREFFGVWTGTNPTRLAWAEVTVPADN